MWLKCGDTSCSVYYHTYSTVYTADLLYFTSSGEFMNVTTDMPRTKKEARKWKKLSGSA